MQYLNVCFLFIRFLLTLISTPVVNLLVLQHPMVPNACSSDTNCSCTEIVRYLYEADCSSLGLKTFPTFTENVTHIILQNNSFYVINETNQLPSNLKWLDISYCGIREIQTGFIKQFQSLEYLDISYNRELTLHVLPNVTHDLQFTAIKILKFDALQCIFGDSTTLWYDHLLYLRNTSLESIHLSSNRIKDIEQFVFLNLPDSLRNITAADNRFELGWSMLEISSLKNIRMVNISYQYKAEEQYWAFLESSCNDSRLTEIYTSYSSSRKLENYLESQEGNVVKNLTSCLADKIGTLSYRHYSIFICMPQNLEFLYFDTIFMRHSELLDATVADFRTLKVIDGSNNYAQSLDGKVFSENLTYADYSNNMLSYINPLFFQGANLSFLNLSRNFLGEQIHRTNTEKIIGNQPYLQSFSLARNGIHKIPKSFFDGFPNLKYLDLSNNIIEKLTCNLKSLKNLEFLNLQYNGIRELSQQQMDFLDELADRDQGHNKSTMTLDLSGNDLLCSCDTLKFIRWLKHHANGNGLVLRNYKNYSCSFANSTIVNFSGLPDFVAKLEKQCESYTALIVACCIAFATMLASIIGGITYRLRWRIRYFYYMAKRGYRRNAHARNKTDCNYKKLFQYDAFISYANEDRSFALHEMKKEVEDKSNVRLCFHQRDFLPGMI